MSNPIIEDAINQLVEGRVAIAFEAYNSRRYSRPWIGKVTGWPVGGRPEILWGRYVGDDGGGEVEIDALSGDIVLYGQKDLRGNNTQVQYGVVDSDLTVKPIDAVTARKLFVDKTKELAAPKEQEGDKKSELEVFSDEQLIAEVKRRGLVL